MDNSLTIIIITWQSKGYVRECLRSIVQTNSETLPRIIVIDNNSCDGTVEMLESEFPQIYLIRNNRNCGVAPARNQGLRLVESDFALLLDADTIVHDGTIRRLVEFMRNHSEAGIAGAKLRLPDGSIQESCKHFPTIWTPLLRRLDFFESVRKNSYYRWQLMSDWDHNSTTIVDYVVGACQIIRTQTMRQIGLLDETIKYGPEDIDFCLRAKHAGWLTYYVHDATVTHYYQRITRKLFSRISWWHVTGLFRYFWKHKYLFSQPE